MEKTITCESVFMGHPDKICDQVSDSILDSCLAQDKKSRVGVETAIKDNKVWLFGEITTNAKIDYKKVALDTLRRIGYKEDFDIREEISVQSHDIALGVDKDGAGDQGIMYGYATDETEEYLPLPLVLSYKISKAVDNLRKTKYPDVFQPDGKCQVSVKYIDNVPAQVTTIVISAQTQKGIELAKVKEIIKKEVIQKIIPGWEKAVVLINPTGNFEIGGPYGDAGLTGRKLMVDTYGGVGHHGGGAFSGKDPSKVDGSAAYYCRYVALGLVKTGLCKRCEVSVSYAIGLCEPISIHVDSLNTYSDDKKLEELVRAVCNFEPSSIRKELNLENVKYSPLASYGHFGRKDVYSPWEETDALETRIKDYLKDHKI